MLNSINNLLHTHNDCTHTVTRRIPLWKTELLKSQRIWCNLICLKHSFIQTANQYSIHIQFTQHATTKITNWVRVPHTCNTKLVDVYILLYITSVYTHSHCSNQHRFIKILENNQNQQTSFHLNLEISSLLILENLKWRIFRPKQPKKNVVQIHKHTQITQKPENKRRTKKKHNC